MVTMQQAVGVAAQYATAEWGDRGWRVEVVLEGSTEWGVYLTYGDDPVDGLPHLLVDKTTAQVAPVVLMADPARFDALEVVWPQ